MPDQQQIMQTMAHQQGQHTGKLKNSLEIIRESVQRESGMDFNIFGRKLLTALQDPNNKLVQFRNTVFLMKRIDPQTVEIHTFSAEPPKALTRRFVEAVEFLKKQGMKKAVTYADNPAYMQIAKATGLPVRSSQVTKTIGGAAKPMYQFEVDL